MRFKISIVLGLCLMYLSCATTAFARLAGSDYEITQKNLQKHIDFLCSDSLEGRLAGTRGEQLATQYLANYFLRLGLAPAGDKGSYFQNFNFTAGIKLGKNNSLMLINQKGESKKLILGQDWRPLSFSSSAAFAKGDWVFAGYGITAPSVNKQPSYDSYRGLAVQNKWVIVFREIPENLSHEQSQQLRQYSSLRYKAFNAQEHGAKGVIFVNNTSSSALKDDLIPLLMDISPSDSGIVALSVKNEVLGALLGGKQQDSLQKLQACLSNPKLCPSSVFGNTRLSGQTDLKKTIRHGRNVLAKLKLNPREAGIIIVGAHVDHLGRGQLGGSRGIGKELGQIHSGADDNASGVASILEAAAKLSDMKKQGKLAARKDILFAAWSGEELGALGSSRFMEKYAANTASKASANEMEVVINLDMIGRLKKNLIVQGVASSPDWQALIRGIKKKDSFSVVTQGDPYLPTDTTSFYLQGIPTVNFFTGAHDDYHTPRDSAEKLNYTGIKDISEFLVDLILALEQKPDLRYQKVKKTGVYTVGGLKIYLGTVPDYASPDISGVRLSGVATDSPAELAGLRRGDIVVALAGKPIHDIYDYTFALNSLLPEKPTKMIIMRRSKKMILTVAAKTRNNS